MLQNIDTPTVYIRIHTEMHFLDTFILRCPRIRASPRRDVDNHRASVAVHEIDQVP